MITHVPIRAVESSLYSAVELYLCDAFKEETVRDAIIGHMSRKTGLFVVLSSDPGMISRGEVIGTAEGIDCSFMFKFSGAGLEVKHA